MKTSSFEKEINVLRNDIDEVDSQLVKLLAKRRKITTNVGKLKSAAGMPIYVPEREAALLRKHRENAENSGLSADLIEDILRRLMRDSYISQDANGYRCVNTACKKKSNGFSH